MTVEFECTVQDFLNEANESLRTASRLKPGRPGDPWLTRPVLGLAEHFRACKLTPGEVQRRIVEVFTLGGHQDRVTIDKVKHILRHGPRQERTGTSPNRRARNRTLPWLLKPIEPPSLEKIDRAVQRDRQRTKRK